MYGFSTAADIFLPYTFQDNV